jgi:hypothetical protein
MGTLLANKPNQWIDFPLKNDNFQMTIKLKVIGLANVGYEKKKWFCGMAAAAAARKMRRTENYDFQ